MIEPKPLAEQDFWRGEAACSWMVADNPAMTNAWVDEESEHAIYAAMICSTCPVRQQCLAEASQDPDAEGLRGGYFFNGGRVLSSDAAKIRRETGRRVRTRQQHHRGFLWVEPVPRAAAEVQ